MLDRLIPKLGSSRPSDEKKPESEGSVDKLMADDKSTTEGSSLQLSLEANSSNTTVPPPGQTLTGKQEHCMVPGSCRHVREQIHS